ncbi:MAG: BMP family ABC transporter substrate-binding protein [Candidatus Lokiarchaeota archaeon]|nr:BMP family ABC transporter substrate-binding protein [Candidatus Lokiarchaeota archaeon]
MAFDYYHGVERKMDKKPIIAIALIAVIGVSAVGLYILFQPVDNPYDVAIVFATGGLGDKSFNDGCYKGVQDAVDDFGITFTYVEPQEVSQYGNFIRQFALHPGYIQPFDLIICIGYDQLAPLMEVAEEFPDQKFAIIDEALDNATTTETVEYPNCLGLKFKEHEGSALVGAMAGMMTTQDKLGFIGGFPIPLIHKFAGGFMWGANYTNPGVSLNISYTFDFGDPETGKTAADDLYDFGCDIIFGAAGASGLGVFTSVKEKNDTISYPIWNIGVDSPQMYLGCEDPEDPEGPSHTITSMLKKVDVAVYEAIEAIVDETFEGGVMEFDIANGGIDYEVNSTLLDIPQNILDTVDDLKEAIKNGTINMDPFSDLYWIEE